MRIPTLTKLYQTGGTVTWKAEFAEVPVGHATTYRVVTNPDDDRIFVTSWVSHRVVRGARRLEQIRLGLKHAKTAA
jgi:uncharacterized protein YbaA (DUF1428 family)